ncbi:MAG: c-type cytochrome [Candidatus Acidiferrales bacterium]
MKTSSLRKATGSGLIVLAVAFVYFGWWAAPGDPASGKIAYENHCLLCHTLNGQPQFTAEKFLRTEIDPLTSNEVQLKSDSQLRKIIVEGDGRMAPVKGLSHRQIVNVIAFVRSLGKTAK